MKLKICLMAMLCVFFQASGQSSNKPYGLKVGDQVPDITIFKILNYHGGTAKLSDFNDKLLILDFWATWCAVCIAHLPDVYDLQQKFSGRVKVLLVNSKTTRDKADAIRKFLDKRKSFYELPCAVEDTLLAALFPHHSVPHYVLIKNNKVLAITDADNINEDNIDHFLADANFKVHVKKDLRYDSRKPLFADFDKNKTGHSSLYRSLLTGAIDSIGLGFGFRFGSNDDFTGFYAINQPLSDIYLTAFPAFADFKHDRIIYRQTAHEFLDSLGIKDFSRDKIVLELSFPPCSKPQALKFIAADLFRYFKLRIDSQYIDTLCYVVRLDRKKVTTETNVRIPAESNLAYVTTSPKYMRNLPVDYLTTALELLYKIPFINETDYTGHINIHLPADVLNEPDLIQSLADQGIIITREKRKVCYVVLTEQPTTN